MNRKLVISIGLLLLALVFEMILWNHGNVLSILLILLAYIKHTLYPIKKELLWYLSICIGGAFVEIILVNVGHGWTYSTPDFLGIPVWIPLFWGFVGTNIIIVYDGLVLGTNKN
jgi:hypothetical protein